MTNYTNVKAKIVEKIKAALSETISGLTAVGIHTRRFSQGEGAAPGLDYILATADGPKSVAVCTWDGGLEDVDPSLPPGVQALIHANCSLYYANYHNVMGR
jgi:hypothetical protein